MNRRIINLAKELYKFSQLEIIPHEKDKDFESSLYKDWFIEKAKEINGAI